MRSLLVGSYLMIAAVLVGFALRGQPGSTPDLAGNVPTFDAERAMDDARRIDALTISSGGRQSGSAGNALAARYIAEEMTRAGLRVDVEPFRDPLGGSMVNVLGELPGNRDEAILIGAHHDTPGGGPGAVAGTAGLAVLLELARSTAAAQGRGRAAGGARSRTVLFASWDGDAFGCAGSSHYAASLSSFERAKLRAAVSLDAVGWKRGTDVIHLMPYLDRMGIRTAPPDWLVTRVSNAARAGGGSLPVGDPWLGSVYQVLVRAVDLGDYSDDRVFLAKGVPAVFISNAALSRPYPHTGTGADRLDQVGADRIAALGRSMETIITDLRVADDLAPGEQDYLVLQPRLVKSFRLTRDQMQVLAMLCLLPGGVVLIRRRRDGGLVVTRVLFFAFATIYVIGALEDPIVFAPIFAPALLAAPLLSVARLRAVWGHVAALLPGLLFGALIIPVYATGSSHLIRLTQQELASVAGLLTIGLILAALHLWRARAAGPGRPASRLVPIAEEPQKPRWA